MWNGSIKALRWIWKKIINLVLFIWEKCIAFIRWIILPASFVTIIIIIIIAVNNYFQTNAQIREIISCLKETIDTQTSMIPKNEMMKYLTKLEGLKKDVFNNNTITFMVSLVIVFLGSILFDIEARAKKYMRDANEKIKKLESERKAMSLYSLIHILFVYYERKNYYRLWKETESILEEFRKDKYRYITKEFKIELSELIRNKMIYYLKNDKRIKPNDKDLNDSIKALENLETEILLLREV